MDNHDILNGPQWKPFQQFGFSHKFWSINIESFVSTCIITCLIILFCLYARKTLQNPQSKVRFVLLKYVATFKDLLEQTLYSCPINHLGFIGSLFTFILACNTISILPFLEEPTKDLNTTFALGVISFIYVQTYSIKVNGIKSYIADYFHPFFLMFPLNVIGTFTSIISLSFRLFGNIFGGYIISSLYSKLLAGSIVLETFGLISGLNIAMMLIFGVFEGLIQAFVFAMLTLTYLSMEIVPEEEDDEEEETKTA